MVLKQVFTRAGIKSLPPYSMSIPEAPSCRVKGYAIADGFLCVNNSNGKFSTLKPVSHCDTCSKSDTVKELISDFDGTKINMLQDSQSLRFRFNVQADIFHEVHFTRAGIVGTNKQILFVLLPLIC